MNNLYSRHYSFLFMILIASVVFSSCSGGSSAVDETWSLVKLVTVGDPIENSSTEFVEVKNCGIPIEKTTDCSAGTSNDLNVTFTGGGALGVGSQFIIEGSVGTTLGIGQQSGQSVKLPIPLDGYIYTYTIEKVYQVVTGEALARSGDGDEQVVNFNFHANCSIDVIDKVQTSCSGVDPTPNVEPPVQPPQHQTVTNNDYRVSSFQACIALCNGQNATISFPEQIKKIFVQFNYENFPSGAKYVRTWSLNGMEWIRYSCNWDGPTTGTEVLTLKEPQGLRSGTWEIMVYVNDVVVLRDQITVNGNYNYWDPAGTINACHGTVD